MTGERYCFDCHRSAAHGERGISILPYKHTEENSMKRTIWILTGVIVILAAGLIGVLLFIGQSTRADTGCAADRGGRTDGARLFDVGRKFPQPVFHTVEN